MIWSRLKENRCPKCRLPLILRAGIHACTGQKCDFAIREAKFDELIQSLYTKKPISYRSEEQNLSDLNNLGREKVSKSFLD